MQGVILPLSRSEESMHSRPVAAEGRRSERTVFNDKGVILSAAKNPCIRFPYPEQSRRVSEQQPQPPAFHSPRNRSRSPTDGWCTLGAPGLASETWDSPILKIIPSQ